MNSHPSSRAIISPFHTCERELPAVCVCLADFLRTRGCFSSISLSASPLATPPQLAHKIAAASGPALSLSKSRTFVARRQSGTRSAQRARSGTAGRRRASRQSEQRWELSRSSFPTTCRNMLVRRDRGRLRRKKVAAGRFARSSREGFRSGVANHLKKTCCSRKSNQCLTSPCRNTGGSR